MSEKLEARVVRIQFETAKTGRIFATSPDMKGLVIGRPTMGELVSAIPQAITDIYAASGVEVVVSRIAASDDTPYSGSWVAFPAEVARRALEVA